MTKKVIPLRASAAAFLLLPALTLGAAQGSSAEQHETDSSAAANAARNTRNEAASSDAIGPHRSRRDGRPHPTYRGARAGRRGENALEGGAYKVVNRLDVENGLSG